MRKRTPIGRTNKRHFQDHPKSPSSLTSKNKTQKTTQQRKGPPKSNIHTSEDTANRNIEEGNEKKVGGVVDWELQEKRRTAISYIYETQYHDAYLAGDIEF
jgi:hypothetical protein